VAVGAPGVSAGGGGGKPDVSLGVIGRSMSRRKLLGVSAHSGDVAAPERPPGDPEADAHDDKGEGLVGSPLWMAPEVCTTARASYKSDIWSLGITAIEIAENRLPHAQLNNAMRIMRAITSSPPPTLAGGKRWSPAFHSFVNTCLAKDPAQRPDAFELLDHPFLKTRDPSPAAAGAGSPFGAAGAGASGPALVPLSTRAVLKPLIDKFFSEKARLEREELEGEGESE
jgi:hypothetical protein